MRSPRPLFGVAMWATAAALVFATCGDDTESAEPGDTTTSTTSAVTSTTEPTTSEPTSTTSADDGGPDMVGDPSTDTIESSEFPNLEQSGAMLVDLRVSSHDGFDRVVLEFEGDEAPTYRVGYLDPPVRADGSGEEVEVEGDAFLEIRAVPASSYDPLSEDAETTYTGPTRIAAEDAGVIREIVRIADFEGHLAWAAGVEGEAPFAVTTLDDPLRLVVDVASDPEAANP